METIVTDVLVEAIILAVRKDVVNSLMETECCKYSKRRIRKLCKKLQDRQDSTESIEEAKEIVRRHLSDTFISITDDTATMPEEEEIMPEEEEIEEPEVIVEEVKPQSKIFHYINKLTII